MSRTRGDVPRLHLLTDPRPEVDPLPVVEAALAVGVGLVQVRRKGGSDRALVRLTEAVVARCRERGALCIVDDRLDVALASGADGVHLGAEDLTVDAARRVAGPALWIGGTCRDPAAGRRLVAEGADYLGVGPYRATRTKSGLPVPLGAGGIAAVAQAVTVPVIAIGGIAVDDVAALVASGVHGVAVTAAVTLAEDPGGAAAALLAALGGPGGAGPPP